MQAALVTSLQQLSISTLLIIISIVFPTINQQLQDCPPNFVSIQNKCFVFNYSCPYPGSLPFSELMNINFTNYTTKYRLNVKKNQELDRDYRTSIPDFFQWNETPGHFGQLFNGNATNYKSKDSEFISYGTELNEFIFQSEADNFTCGYDESNLQYNASFCQFYDTVCLLRYLEDKKNTPFNSTNCHCLLLPQNHYCQFNCPKVLRSLSPKCFLCEHLYNSYRNPGVHMVYNLHAERIDVGVTSYRKAFHYKKQPLVYCYTNANYSKHDVTYRYDFIKDYNTSNDRYYNIIPVENRTGHYWCVTFKYTNATLEPVKTWKIIAENFNTTIKPQSFTVQIAINNSYTQENKLTIHEELEEELREILYENDISVNFLTFLVVNNKTLIAYRCYTDSTGSMKTILQKTKERIENITDKNFTLHETFASYCLENVTRSNGRNLTWKETLLGMTVLPEELCLKQDKSPVTRTCKGEYLEGVYWSEVEGECYNHTLEDIKTTAHLHNLSHSNTIPDDKIEELQQIMKNYNEYLMVDAHFISATFENISRDSHTFDLFKFVEIASDFSAINRDILARAQAKLNATDRILYNLDVMLARHNFTGNFTTIQTQNLHIQISRINSTITGAGFYNTEDRKIRQIYNDTNLEDLTLENLHLAAFVSETELLQLRKLNLCDAKLIVVLFRQHSLFNQNEYVKSPGDYVGFYVSGFHEPFMYDSVKILIKPDRLYRARIDCASWKYGRDQLWINRRGNWNRESIKAKLYRRFYLCEYNHMTHFAMLINMETNLTLNIITLIGCTLSMLGSIAVISTAVLNKTWREQSGSKVLLNLVVTLLAQNIVLTVSSEVDGLKNENACIAIGALLHYCVCSQFCWMLIVGYLQYQRYVKVFFTVNDKFVLKISIAAWGLPLLPVASIMIIDKQSYVHADYCYLNDRSLYYAVFLPVSIIIILNIVIFVAIVHSVYRIKGDVYGLKEKVSLLQLRLFVILFFLLGLYWIFGIGASLLNSLTLNYLFCISASFQGVIMFVYYIVFNKMTKNYWKRLLKLDKVVIVAKEWLNAKKNVGTVKPKETNFYKISSN